MIAFAMDCGKFNCGSLNNENMEMLSLQFSVKAISLSQKLYD